MRSGLNPTLVKQPLASHSWIGVTIEALMYLVCLSGILAVFYPEFERWEQPSVPETTDYDPAAVASAYREIVASGEPLTHHMFVALPTEAVPRTSISSENQGWFLEPDGSLGPVVGHDWTQMLIDLHLYLHLPHNSGMVVVSALGTLLCGLIISGFLAHPRLIKDAFLLRLGGSRHLEQADIHNRLSVWGAPVLRHHRRRGRARGPVSDRGRPARRPADLGGTVPLRCRRQLPGQGRSATPTASRAARRSFRSTGCTSATSAART